MRDMEQQMSDNISVQEAHDLVTKTLVRCRTGTSQAGHVADALVGAELAGQAGHGLRRVPSYAAQALSGKVDGFAVPTAELLRPGTLAIDAAHGFAYPAMAVALERLPEMARAQGIAAAGIRRSHHAGVTGVPVETMAKAGFAALILVNSPPAMAPWGGARALMGTNPIAFAAPVPRAEPLVVDLSVSKVARGKIMAAAQRGDPIPEGWALDSEGNPTTDAKAGLAGTMVPMADAKGAALALMVEILAAGLTGANFAAEASSFFEAEGSPPGTGQIVIAIDPAAFGAAGAERIAAFAKSVEAVEGTRLPGRRRQQLRAARMRDGIPVEPALLAEIERLGR